MGLAAVKTRLPEGTGWNRGFWRWSAVAVLVGLGALAIVTYTLNSAPIITDSDFAVSELYVELATRGELLVGAYSRFGWHHPGPVYFYLTAPFYELGGQRAAALFAVALAINLASLFTMAWVLTREARGPMAAAVVGAFLLFAWRLPWFLASPWNAHVAVVPSVAFLVVAAAVASGRTRLMPLMVVFGSFATQTHVGFVPVVVAITAAAVASRVFGRTTSDPSPWPALNASMWVAVALWALPMSEALSQGGGNVAALWQFFVTEASSGHSIREAVITGSYGLAGMLRPDFDLPWGGHFELQYLGWSVPGAFAAVVLLVLVARRDLAAGRRFEGWLALVALGATVTAVWGLTRVRGEILNHDLFRLAATGALDLGILGAAGLRAAAGVASRWFPGQAAARASLAVVVLLTVAVGLRDLEAMTSFERRRLERRTIVDAHRAVRDYVASEDVRKPLIRIGEDRWADAAGALLRLLQDGTPAAVMDAHIPMFTRAFAATGDEDALVTFADPGLHHELGDTPDAVILLEASPLFVHATRIAPKRPGAGK